MRRKRRRRRRRRSAREGWIDRYPKDGVNGDDGLYGYTL
jgi:hypothetical protein